MSTVTTKDATTGPDDARDDVLLRVRGLEVHFPIKRGIIFDRTVGHVRAVDGVDLDVRRGRTYGLVGESGCGKSTLGRAILRLETPTNGSVVIDGVDLGSLKPEALRRARRRMQMVFQDPMASLDPRQNVESLLTEPLRAHADAMAAGAATAATSRPALIMTDGLRGRPRAVSARSAP